MIGGDDLNWLIVIMYNKTGLLLVITIYWIMIVGQWSPLASMYSMFIKYDGLIEWLQ